MRIVVAILLFVVSTAVAAQEVSPRKQALIDELHRLTFQEAQATAIFEQGAPAFISQMKRHFTTVPEDVWQQASDMFLGEFRAELPAFAVAINTFWAQNFTEKEIEDLIIFYKTPTGQKLAQKRGELNLATQKAGQAWGSAVGRRAGEKVEQFLRSKGYQPRT